jgi:hypothetical protein
MSNITFATATEGLKKLLQIDNHIKTARGLLMDLTGDADVSPQRIRDILSFLDSVAMTTFIAVEDTKSALRRREIPGYESEADVTEAEPNSNSETDQEDTKQE